MFYVRPDLNTIEIEKRVDDYSLFRNYCENFVREDVKFKSEFRKDKNPSASITLYKGRLWYKDFGDPTIPKALNIYGYIMYKYSIDFVDSLKKINNDFQLGLGYNINIDSAPVKYKVHKKEDNVSPEKDILSEIKVRRIKFEKKHIDYWHEYDINKKDIPDILTKFKTYPISHFWIKKDNIENLYTINNIGFTYDYFWHLQTFLRKIYIPGTDLNASTFYTNCNTLITQGYDQLPKTGDLVFITSSMKDVILLDYIGFSAVAPSNENVFIQEHIFEDLKNRFKKIVILYDNDYHKPVNYGVMFAQKHSEKHNIPYIILPDGSGKDPSDFSKILGRKKLKEVITDKLQNV